MISACLVSLDPELLQRVAQQRGAAASSGGRLEARIVVGVMATWMTALLITLLA